MAYVRKTETLIDDVVRRIRNMAAKALGVYESKSIEIDTAEYAAACEAIHTAAYRDAPQLRGNLPESWLFKTERINLRIKDHSGNTIARAGLDAPEHRKFEVPRHMKDSWSVDVDHASLNAAIKEMPEIELYVPDQYLRKMHEAVAPRVKKEEQQSAITELGIDRNALAAVAIAHRVMS